MITSIYVAILHHWPRLWSCRYPGLLYHQWPTPVSISRYCLKACRSPLLVASYKTQHSFYFDSAPLYIYLNSCDKSLTMIWEYLAVAALFADGSHGQSLGSASFLRFGCSQLVVERVDPLVAPGLNPSSHVHQIVGGNSFNVTVSYSTWTWPSTENMAGPYVATHR